MRVKGVTEVILNVDGVRTATHVPVRCRTTTCILRGKYVWSNFVATARGAHSWTWAREEWPDPFMHAPTFGVSQAWFEQFSRRLVLQRPSFWGEAEVHWRPGCRMSRKGRFRKLLMKSWYQTQILRRTALIEGSSLQVPSRLDRRVEDVLGELWPRIEPHMRSRRRHQAGAAGTVWKPVMDGHQKLTRRCCGIFCGGVTKSAELGKFCLHPCPATPLVRGRWCARHAALLREPVELPQKSQHSDRVRVRRMECLGRGLHELIRVDVSSAGDGQSTQVIPILTRPS